MMVNQTANQTKEQNELIHVVAFTAIISVVSQDSEKVK